MNLIRHILIIFFIITGTASAINVDEVMDKANKEYRENNFTAAIAEYEKLLDDGYKGTSLFYNLGNAYYRIGKLGYAILYYEKALKLSPNDEDIKHNLALAYSGTIDKIETMPRFFFFEWWENFLAIFSIDGWIVFTLAIYLLLLAVVAAYFFTGRIIHPRISFFAGSVILIILFVTSSVTAVKLNRENKRLEAVILENSVIVKLSPDIHGKDGFMVHEGLKILLEDEIDDWKKIRLPDGKIGWVKENQIATI